MVNNFSESQLFCSFDSGARGINKKLVLDYTCENARAAMEVCNYLGIRVFKKSKRIVVLR